MQAQAYIPFKGIQHKKHPKIAIVNANIQTSPEQLLKEATLLINGNIIQDVGTEIKVPEDFIIISSLNLTSDISLKYSSAAS